MSEPSSTHRTVPQNWLTRRGFVEAGARSGVFASLVASYATTLGAAPRRFETTDPKLLRYREARRFPCLRPDPRRLTLGPDGRLWIAAGGYVCGFDDVGTAVTEHALPGTARCVAVSPDGTQLFVGVSSGGKDAVHVLNPGLGTRLATWDSPGPKTWFTALAVTADQVFAADSGNRVILRYDRSGKLLGRIGAKDKARDIPGFVLPSPYLDVVVHPDGLLRVNNAGRHKVEAYTPEGDLEASWGKPGMGIEGFCGCCNPVSLATLPGGQIVTCEKGLPRVKVYSAQGEFDGVVAGVESFSENARVATGESPGDGVRASLDAVADPQGRIYVLDTVTGLVRVMVRKEAV
jgi:hypothetical protein